MPRLLLALLTLLSLCALAQAPARGLDGAGWGATPAVDGGAAPSDAGRTDAGRTDGGHPAAGAPPRPRARWEWVHGDGGWLLDGGVSDILTVSVGETAEVRFPHPIILMQCDEVLLSLSATQDTLLLKGEQAGHTQCGFWWFKQAWPNRMMDVTVSPLLP